MPEGVTKQRRPFAFTGSLLFPTQTFYRKQIPKGNDWHHWIFAHQNQTREKAYECRILGLTGPLFALCLVTDYYRHFLEGFSKHLQDTGFLPKWLAPDERGMMVLSSMGSLRMLSPKDRTRPTCENMLTALCSKRPKKQITAQHFTVAMAMKATRPIGYLPRWFSRKCEYSLDCTYSDFCIATVVNLPGLKQPISMLLLQPLLQNIVWCPNRLCEEARSMEAPKSPSASTQLGGDCRKCCSATQATFGTLDPLGIKANEWAKPYLTAGIWPVKTSVTVEDML